MVNEVILCIYRAGEVGQEMFFVLSGSLQYTPTLHIRKGKRCSGSEHFLVNGMSVILYSSATAVVKTSNGRLHVKLGSDRHETLPKRVSDDSRHF